MEKIFDADKRGRREELIDRAKKIDPKGGEELAEEVKRDKETEGRFIGRK